MVRFFYFCNDNTHTRAVISTKSFPAYRLLLAVVRFDMLFESGLICYLSLTFQDCLSLTTDDGQFQLRDMAMG